MSIPLSNNPKQKDKHILHLYTLLNDPICITRRASLNEFGDQKVLRLHALESLTSIEEQIPQKHINRSASACGRHCYADADIGEHREFKGRGLETRADFQRCCREGVCAAIAARLLIP